MTYKIALFDVDGTLVNGEKELQPATVAAIRRLAARGVKLALATGRPPSDLKPILAELDFEYLITCNGGIVTGPEGVIAATPLAPATLEKVIALAEAGGHPYVLRTLTEAYGYPHEHPWIQEVYRILKVDPPLPGRGLPAEPVYQALFFTEEQFDATHQAALPETYFVRFHPRSVDVGPAGVTKAAGIATLLDHLGLSPAEAIAFGDGLNDVEMLQYVGCGVAMGQAPTAVQAAARHVTRSVEDDGIAWFLTKEGLI